MGRGHDHGVSVADAGSASGKYVRRLILAIGLGLVTFVTQLVVGLSTSSLALLSDSAHVFGVVMALVAILVARPAPRRVDRSYGMYRAEWSRHRNSWPTPTTSTTARAHTLQVEAASMAERCKRLSW